MWIVRIAGPVLATLALVSLVIWVVLSYLRGTDKALELSFVTCFLLACAGSGVSALVWSLRPQSSVLCLARVWLFFVSVAVMAAACLGRLAQVIAVWRGVPEVCLFLI
jgi:hypothetical protein